MPRNSTKLRPRIAQGRTHIGGVIAGGTGVGQLALQAGEAAGASRKTLAL